MSATTTVTAGTSVVTPVVDTAGAVGLAIGGTTATTVSVSRSGQTTAVLGALTVASGATVTGAVSASTTVTAGTGFTAGTGGATVIDTSSVTGAVSTLGVGGTIASCQGLTITDVGSCCCWCYYWLFCYYHYWFCFC